MAGEIHHLILFMNKFYKPTVLKAIDNTIKDILVTRENKIERFYKRLTRPAKKTWYGKVKPEVTSEEVRSWWEDPKVNNPVDRLYDPSMALIIWKEYGWARFYKEKELSKLKQLKEYVECIIGSSHIGLTVEQFSLFADAYRKIEGS